MTKINWDHPLELEDGTEVVFTGRTARGNYGLHRKDGESFTPAQVHWSGRSDAVWRPDGSRVHNHPGLRVRNKYPIPEDAGDGWVYHDGTNQPVGDVEVEVLLRGGWARGPLWQAEGPRMAAGWVWHGPGAWPLHSADICFFREVKSKQPPADVPDWAIERVFELPGVVRGTYGWTVDVIRRDAARPVPYAVVVMELARRIAESEEPPAPPIDPDLETAREACALAAGNYQSKVAAYRAGDCDTRREVQLIVTALKEARAGATSKTEKS